MLGGYDLIAFVATTDPARARRFYEGTLGLKLVEQTSFAVVFEVNGVMLRVTTVQSHTPPPYTVLGWKVPDVRVAAQDLANGGVAPERYAFLDQDELGVWTSPDGAKVAWFKDPDGNLLSISQN